MRNKFLLLSAFTVAATLSLGVTDADAATKKSHKTSTVKVAKAKHKAGEYDAIGAYAVNTAGCPVPPQATQKVEDWKTAKLTAQFIKQSDGTYKAYVLPGAVNEDEKVPIASITKLMTALVIFDLVDQKKMDLSQPIPVSKESLCLGDNRFAVIGLPAHITEIVGDHAMTQMLKISSNTMALNLAVAAAGSQREFIDMLNAKAAAWGMTNTRFVNPHGLPVGDRKGEYTTAMDMLIMAEHVLPYMERFRQYEAEPLRTWTLPEYPIALAEKRKLTEMGAIFKTATVAKCRSLLTVAEQDGFLMADIQLCDKDRSRFVEAVATVGRTFKTAFSRIGNMIVPSANASEVRRPSPEGVSVSSLPTRSSEP